MMGRDGSGNQLAPNLTLKLNPLLQEFPQSQRKDELTQVTFLILRNISNLRQVYHFYCTLGHNRVQNTKSEMTRLQFWRFLKDSHIHHHGLSLPEMDRIIANCLGKGSVHQPTERLSLSDFLSSITILSFVIFKDKIKTNNRTNGKSKKDKSKSPVPISEGKSLKSSSYILPQCLQMLFNEHIMKHSGRVKGGFLSDPRRAINALAYMEGSWKVYRSLCDQQSHEPTLVMRKLLFALKDFQIIGPRLSTEVFLKILISDHPSVCEDGVYNLEIEMSFLEYFEALVACAVTFVDEDMLHQPIQIAAPRRQRSFHSGPSSAGSGIGHSRPGSAYLRHTSARSGRSTSSQPTSISSIGEDESDVEHGSEASTMKPPEPVEVEPQGPMGTAISGMEGLQIVDPVVQSSTHSRSPSSIDMSSIFEDMDDDEEIPAVSPKSKGSSPEVITADMEDREREFITWSSQLHIFFTKYLFPAWQRVEILRREAARHRVRKLAL